MALEFVRIRNVQHSLFAEAMRLYSVSFPYHEQREAPAQRAVMGDEEYYFYAILEDGVFAGAALCWVGAEFIYVEHFCILEELRNRGIGSRSLEKLCGMGLVILEIDPPCDEISLRRKEFYQRAGFFENPYAHRHPPYHAGCEGHELVVMTSGRPINEQEYGAFAAYLSDRVMSYK